MADEGVVSMTKHKSVCIIARRFQDVSIPSAFVYEKMVLNSNIYLNNLYITERIGKFFLPFQEKILCQQAKTKFL